MLVFSLSFFSVFQTFNLFSLRMHFYTFYPSLFTLLVFLSVFFVVLFLQFSSFALLNAIWLSNNRFFFSKICSSPVLDWKAHFEITYSCVKCMVMADKPNSAFAFQNHVRFRLWILYTSFQAQVTTQVSDRRKKNNSNM